MAYIIKLGTYAKKRNSTAQPDMTGWAEYDVTLKNGSDLINPVLDLRIDESDIVNYNYAYIFGSYFWIRSKAMIRSGLCTIRLEKDLLATYKEAIGSLNLYIIRSSAVSNGYIKDNMYPMLANFTMANQTVLDNNNITLSQGCYVVSVLGDTVGSSTLYLMTPAEFSAFLRSLLGIVAGYVNLDFSTALVRSIYEPMDYIRSVIWLPFSKATAESTFGAISTGSSNIHCGLWDSGQTGEYLSTAAGVAASWSIPLTKHPQEYRGKYLNAAPYTEHVIDFPPFGTIRVPADKLIDAEYLNIQLVVDAVTGMGILQAAGSSGSSGVLVNVSAQYGVPIPIAGATANISAMGSAIIGAGEFLGGLITANLPMAAMGAAKGIGGFEGSIGGDIKSSGSGGSLAAYQVDKTFYSLFHYIADEDNLDHGRPYCQMTTPAALGGYMIADDAPISLSAMPEEVEGIREYLTTGFYYE